MYYVLILAISAVLGLIPANIAKEKCYSFGLWWFYGWMLFIVVIIHVQFIPDKNAPKSLSNNSNTSQSIYTQPIAYSTANELKKYKELLDTGGIDARRIWTEKERNTKQTRRLIKCQN